MVKLSEAELRELRWLEGRVELALQAASAGPRPAPRELRDLLLDALGRLRVLASGSEARPDAVESIERGLAALEAWHRWQPPTQPSA